MKLFDVQVSPFLTGSKNAVLKGSILTVSPAMYDLMKNADADELEELLASIGTIDMSEYKATLILTPKERW